MADRRETSVPVRGTVTKRANALQRTPSPHGGHRRQGTGGRDPREVWKPVPPSSCPVSCWAWRRPC
eukprot:3588680-Prorocentrum_lima.AAC.1